MLKKNWSKAGFLGHGLLLLVPASVTFKLNPDKAKTVAPRYGTGPVTSDSTALDAITLDSASFKRSADSARATSIFAAPKIKLNKYAVKFVNLFLKREEESLVEIKGRSKPYFTLIDSVFTKFGLPLQLKYLAVVESDLKPAAVSRVGAKGLWQLMPSTARDFGLKVTKKADERTYHYKSTVAAAKYLKCLYSEFGDWLLAIAAYNSGSGSIYNAIRKAGTRNFWSLQRFLSEETRSHVKRFIGVHYFFEGQGSVTTLTKSEAEAYSKTLAQLESDKNKLIDSIQTSEEKAIASADK
jgi:membrane-bound lytic murein transglycosylase D